MVHRSTLLALLLPFSLTPILAAQAPPCQPCAGFRTSDPGKAAELLASFGGSPERRPLYVAWNVDLAPGTDVTAAVAPSKALRDAGVTPWIRLRFFTPGPLATAGAPLEAELDLAAALAKAAAPDTHFEVVWAPGGTEGGELELPSFGFLLKRAAVAVTGARPEARVLAGPVHATGIAVGDLHALGVAPYLDGYSIRSPHPQPVMIQGLRGLQKLELGLPVIVDAEPMPPVPEHVIDMAADRGAAGAGITFFDLGEPTADELRPFVTLAQEFAGDLSFDPDFKAELSGQAWGFVRGSDLGLRVALGAWGMSEPTVIKIADGARLQNAEAVDPRTGETIPGLKAKRVGTTLEISVSSSARALVLRLGRGLATDLAGSIEDELTVESTREIPLEEILRRLQAFEDDQKRKLDHFAATNTTHLRFGAGAGLASVEATLEGDFFFRQGQGFDWAWQNFYLNGIRWRGEKIPEIPLLQPEKAAVMPVEITFTPNYDYRLVESDAIDGREAWVIDFRPAPSATETKLYRGRVWVDKATFARLRTRAVQLGLEGEVISNEETLYYSPVDANGQPVAWSADAYVLALRLVGQQLISVLNSTTLVEREMVLSAVQINGEDFEGRRQAVLASKATMVRDTDKGLRYLVTEGAPEGERVVQEDFDTSRLFALGGVFADDSLDYPLPLAGVNYLDFDFKGTGNQLNVFFAGVLAIGSYADPKFLGSKFDFGGDLFFLGIATSDQLYRDEEEIVAEEVEVRPANASLKLGRPLGQFVKLDLEYEVASFDFGRADETAAQFVLPEDHLLHTAQLSLRFARGGYKFDLEGDYGRRSEWSAWGLPGNDEFDPDHRDFLHWRATAAKTWHLPRFQKVGAEVGYLGGQDLDRFSKYQFGFFGGDSRVHGFQGGKVRAEEAWAAHLSYGFEVGKAFRLEAVVDGAWITDEVAGFDQEPLAGVGLVGTFLGPWETVVNLDVGVPVTGPDDGFVAYLVFLKLFD
jgi:hypothetical protein